MVTVAPIFKRFFTSTEEKNLAHGAYWHVVEQARLPIFYRDWGVPDTLDGRFDLLALHLCLIIDRLAREPQAALFVRALSELFFADMDRSLREMGAGDTGVGIRIKNMAQAFYGRLKAYQEATGTVTLQATLKRNIWRGQPVAEDAVTSLVAYVERNRDGLRAQPTEALIRGEIHFLS